MNNSIQNHPDEKLINIILIIGFLLILGGLSAFIYSNKVNSWLFLLLPVTTIGTIIAAVNKIRITKNTNLKFTLGAVLVLLTAALVFSLVWWVAASGA